MRTERTGRALAITGGIACGKSEVGRTLEELGVPVLDADAVAREVMLPGRPAYRAVVERFGPTIVGPDGAIDRTRLGRKVFADPEALRALNARVHPETLRRIRAWRDARRKEGADCAVMVPLLFEAGAAEGWDAVWCVTAPAHEVRARLAARGLDAESIDRRIAAQWPTADKAARADECITNDADLDALRQQVRARWAAWMEEGE